MSKTKFKGNQIDSADLVNSPEFSALVPQGVTTYGDLANTTYTNKSFAFNNEDLAPSDLFISPDGTKMFMTGNSGNSVDQYTLSVAWDISSATHNTTYTDNVGGTPYGIHFKPDGTRMYIIDDSSNYVREHILSTAWDLSTASYNTFLSISAHNSICYGITFNSTGTRMYTTGHSNRIFGYTLSTAWSLGTAEYDGTFETLAEVTTVRGIAMGYDDETLYMQDSGLGVFLKYIFTTPEDTSTLTYTGQQFDHGTEITNVSYGCFVSANALYDRYIFAIDIGDYTGHQYEMASTGSIATPASTDEAGAAKLATSAEVITGTNTNKIVTPEGLADFEARDKSDTYPTTYWSPDGYDMSGTYTSKFYYHGPTPGYLYGVFFNDDGTRAYGVYSAAGECVFQWILTTPWDISSAGGSPVQEGYDSAETASATGMFIKQDDGTKMYLCDSANDIYQYTLGTAWDITTASYDSKTLDTTTWGNSDGLQGMWFRPDGTYMYTIGSTQDRVREWALITAWDISTAIFTGKSLYVAATAGSTPNDIAFNDDGTLMFILDSQGDDITKYNLSTAWDITTAVNEATTLLVNSEETTPHGMFFGDGGSKVYIVGAGGSANIFQYDTGPVMGIQKASETQSGLVELATQTEVNDGEDALRVVTPSTLATNLTSGTTVPTGKWAPNGWDPGSGSYTGKSAGFADSLGGADGIHFKSDGTELYLCYLGSTTVYQYTLSTAWDIHTMTQTASFSVSGQISAPVGIQVSEDGTKLYVQNNSGGTIYEYDLGTNYLVSSAVYNSANFAPGVNGTDFYIRDDGLWLAILNSSSDRVQTYNLTTAWDITSAIYRYDYASTTNETDPRGLFFSSDGMRAFVVGASGDDINHYDLIAPWTVTGYTWNNSNLSVTTEDTSPAGLFFKPDGGTMWMVGQTGSSTIYEYDVTSGKTITAASATTDGIAELATSAEVIAETDTERVVTPETLAAWRNSNLPASAFVRTGWDLANAAFDDTTFASYYNAVGTYQANDIVFKPDGTECFILKYNSGTNAVSRLILATAWDIDSATSFTNLTVTEGTNFVGMRFSTDGTKMFLLASSGCIVYQYTMGGSPGGTPWDIANAVYDSVSYDAGTTGGGLEFNPDGTIMYVADDGANTVREHYLTTAWDISSVTAGTSISVSPPDNGPQSLTFNNDGTKMFIVGEQSNDIDEWQLVTPYRLAGATTTGVDFSLDTWEVNPRGIEFNSDGTVMYIVGLNATGTYGFHGTVYHINTAGTSTSLSIDYDSFSDAGVESVYRKNIIINGNFNIWQRGTSHTPNATIQYLPDRFFTYADDGAGVATVRRSSNVPILFDSGIKANYSLEWDITTALASPTGTNEASVSYRIEGYDYASLAGADATLSFWFFATKTGTYSVDFRNKGNDRSYVTEFTVTSSNQWEKKSITIPLTGDDGAIGSPLGNDWNYANGMGLEIIFNFMIASGHSSATSTLDEWTNTADYCSTNQVNAYDSASNFIRMALVQFEAGSAATKFEFRHISDEIALCQRYYFASDTDINTSVVCRANSTSSYYGGSVFLPTTMRDVPQITLSNTSILGGTIGSMAADNISTEVFRIYDNSATITQGEAIAAYFDYTANAEL